MLAMNQIPIIKLKGTSRQMGRQHGESLRTQIHALYAIRLQNALDHAIKHQGRTANEADFLSISRASLALQMNYDKETYFEVLGICEGANISKEKLFALQGLTDFRDSLTWGQADEGCTVLGFQKDKIIDSHHLTAQTWDLAHDNMPYVIGMIREPKEGPKTASLTVCGGLNMAGLNEYGIACLTNNLKSTDSQSGIPYLSLMHKALKQDTFAKAIECIKGASRAGAHFYLITDSEGRSQGIEALPNNHRIIAYKDNFLVHTNHLLHPDLQELEAYKPQSSTLARLTTAQTLCRPKQHSISSIKHILSDRSQKENSINRQNGPDHISTNGAVIIDHKAAQLHLCRSYPNQAEWQIIQL
jgi:hypothetical protein